MLDLVPLKCNRQHLYREAFLTVDDHLRGTDSWERMAGTGVGQMIR